MSPNNPASDEQYYGPRTVVASRDERYGSPRTHFERTLRLVCEVLGSDRKLGELAPEDWAVVMMCDKLARFAHTNSDEDAMTDVAGYADTWFMARERHIALRDSEAADVDELLSE